MEVELFSKAKQKNDGTALTFGITRIQSWISLQEHSQYSLTNIKGKIDCCINSYLLFLGRSGEGFWNDPKGLGILDLGRGQQFHIGGNGGLLMVEWREIHEQQFNKILFIVPQCYFTLIIFCHSNESAN